MIQSISFRILIAFNWFNPNKNTKSLQDLERIRRNEEIDIVSIFVITLVNRICFSISILEIIRA